MNRKSCPRFSGLRLPAVCVVALSFWLVALWPVCAEEMTLAAFQDQYPRRTILDPQGVTNLLHRRVNLLRGERRELAVTTTYLYGDRIGMVGAVVPDFDGALEDVEDFDALLSDRGIVHSATLRIGSRLFSARFYQNPGVDSFYRTAEAMGWEEQTGERAERTRDLWEQWGLFSVHAILPGMPVDLLRCDVQGDWFQVSVAHNSCVEGFFDVETGILREVRDVRDDRVTRLHVALPGELHAENMPAFMRFPEAEMIEKAEAMAERRAAHGGIGAVVRLDAEKQALVVTEVIADRGEDGLREGDFILAIDDQPVEGRSLPELVRSLRGRIGCPVVLLVEREGAVFDVSLERIPIRR